MPQWKTIKPANQPAQGKWRTIKPARQDKKRGAVGSAFNFAMRNLIKPVASAANLVEDVGKTAGFGIANLIKPELKFKDVRKSLDVAPIKHQRDVWAGRNQRTYSDIMNEIAGKEKNPILRAGMKTAGYTGDFT